MKSKDHVQIQKYDLEYKGWFDIDIENVRKRNIIRIFKNGQLDKDDKGNITRLTSCDAWMDENEVWHIESDGFKIPELTGEET